jgi:Family of unknown function (DUF6982)
MAGSTTKKAIVRRFDRESLAGYVNPLSYLQLTGIELLLPDGNVLTVPYAELKTVAFVRDFDTAAETVRTFNTRPKMDGLWVSFEFRDGEVMEGILPNNLLPVEPYGFTAIPPNPVRDQRVFVPRAALRSVAVLGVVGSPLNRRRQKPAGKDQIGLFEG